MVTFSPNNTIFQLSSDSESEESESSTAASPGEGTASSFQSYSFDNDSTVTSGTSQITMSEEDDYISDIEQGITTDEVKNYDDEFESTQRQQKILRSVRETTSPIESYEETVLMKSIESKDPATGTSAKYFDQATGWLPITDLAMDPFSSFVPTTPAPPSTGPSRPPVISNRSRSHPPSIPSLRHLPTSHYWSNNYQNQSSFAPSAHHRRTRSNISTRTSTRTVEEELFHLTRSIHEASMPVEEQQQQQQATQQSDPAANKKKKNIFQRRRKQKQQQRDESDKKNIRRRPSIIDYTTDRVEKHRNSMNTSSTGCFDSWSDLIYSIKQHRSDAWQYMKNVTLFFVVPAIIVAFLLYYVFENPGGIVGEGPLDFIEEINNTTSSFITGDVETHHESTTHTVEASSSENDYGVASYSWWCLYVVRLTITFCLARGIQYFVVTLIKQINVNKTNYLTAKHKDEDDIESNNKNRNYSNSDTLYNRAPGMPLATMFRLYILQSAGLPLQLQIWGVLNFMLCFGKHEFAKHWLFYQDFLTIFTISNPSGGVTWHYVYRNLLVFSIFSGCVVGFKRFVVGLRFGKTSYDRYATKLTTVLEDVVDVTKIARFATSRNKAMNSASAYTASGSTTDFATAAAAATVLHSSFPATPSSSPPRVVPTANNTAITSTPSNSSGGSPPTNDEDNNDKSNVVIIKNDSDDSTEKGTAATRKRVQIISPATSSQAALKKDINKIMLRSSDAPRAGGANMTDSTKIQIDQLLGEWEDLDLIDEVKRSTDDEPTSLSSIVQFRASIGLLDTSTPFSNAFGIARNRLEVIDGSQKLYAHLLEIQRANDNAIVDDSSKEEDYSDDESSHSSTTGLLKFQTIALSAMDGNTGNLDKHKVKRLISLFRPNRQGQITLLEFCKAVDTIYKDMRKLRASIINEGRMNAASERIVNALFYFLLAYIGVGALGIDPLKLLAILGSFIISFSFMISGASSDYIRGLLFILVQRPFDVGDRINVNGVEKESHTNGSKSWIVKDVTLYHTTVIYSSTGEYATYSNGALSKSRIINCARSPQAQLHFMMKFGIDVPQKSIDEFELEIKDYVQSQRRVWLGFIGFRLTRIEANEGFVEYKVIVQHRDSWQVAPAMLTDLGRVQSMAVKISKSKGMNYKSPPLPIQMNMPQQAFTSTTTMAEAMATAETTAVTGFP